jgi:iron(III) transport system ATP-binding protein
MSDLRTSDLSKRYFRAPRDAVHRVSLVLEHGEVLAVLGESGCGKTTLLRLIAGLETPTAGTIEIGGRIVFDRRSVVPPERRGVGMVFQDNTLFPHLRVADNVCFGLHGQPRARQRERAREMLALVGMEAFAGRYPHELSGGQQQRAALARALAPAPTLLLLDEPFSSLDAVLKAQVRDELSDIIHRAGATAVFVLHDAEDALGMADRIAVLRDGIIQQIGSPDIIYRHPRNEYVARFFGRVNVLPGVPCDGGFLTPLGRVRVPVANGRHSRVTLSIRPECVEVCSDPDTGVSALVRRTRFCGSHLEVVVAIHGADGLLHDVVMHCPSDTPAVPGSTVFVRSRDGGAQLLERD